MNNERDELGCERINICLSQWSFSESELQKLRIRSTDVFTQLISHKNINKTYDPEIFEWF